MVACFGDSIILMLAPFLHCAHLWGRVGEHTNVIARHVFPSAIVVISVGSNDDPNAVLLRNLRNLRANLGFSRVVWVLPHESHRAAIVTAVAASAHDRTIPIVNTVRDGVHPRNPRQLAQEVLRVAQ